VSGDGGLVGRHQLRTRLRRAAEAALMGNGQAVLLTGEPGIGKTALAAEASGWAADHGARVVWGWGWQGDGAPALWPWVQVVRSLASSGSDLPSLHRLLPDPQDPLPPPGEDALPAALRFQLFDEISSLLLAAAGERPLVLVLDDLQWADPPSLLLLDFLPAGCGRPRSWCWGPAATWRSTTAPAPRCWPRWPAAAPSCRWASLRPRRSPS
jgi:hypothetical protein